MTRRILEAIDRGETIAVVSLLESEAVPPARLGSRLVVPEQGTVVGGFGDAALDEAAVASAREVITAGVGGQRRIVDAAGRSSRLYIELIESPPWLVVVGAGHVAKPTAALGKMVGFRVTVLDDRPDFANWERFPEADEVIADDFRLTLERLVPLMHRQTYVVLVTRGHRQDEMVLRQVIGSRAGYIGMIGSRRRARLVLETLLAEGFPEERVRQVRSPIGLDIRAETPEEIAVSIIGEIISVRRGGTARTLSGRPVLRQTTRSHDGPGDLRRD
ncbi:MAG: XdhC/CoxI family protein [Chloroflexota bacterium]|nr:XdhC/CoxI family protein [Dehalococcoidia bacterium]MDW8253786.1 XdhC/CoxI family protein [Chloroflexota bacterium]